MIAIVDTGGANLASVTNALDRLQRPWKLTTDQELIRAAPKVILPGVGHAADSMGRLEARGLIPLIRSLEQPVLGICLGMQLLFSHSDEGGDVPCLGVIPGRVQLMAASPEITIPHMGWNGVQWNDLVAPLFAGIRPGAHFYFVHSFKAPDGDWVGAVARHGQAVPAVVRQNNFFGAQFHPERSGRAGARFLENFLDL